MRPADKPVARVLGQARRAASASANSPERAAISGSAWLPSAAAAGSGPPVLLLTCTIWLPHPCSNDAGQLGTYNRNAAAEPTLAMAPHRFTAASAGFGFVCGVQADTKDAYCWG